MIVVDTGPLVAAAIGNDQDHQRCVEMFAWQRRRGPMLVPSLVVAETCFMIEREGGSRIEAEFLRSLVSGLFQLVELRTDDVSRAAELVERYADLPLGAVDASVVAIAERYNVDTVATLDRKHFSIVRPRHTSTLTLVPKLR